jgi:hypothetical protein
MYIYLLGDAIYLIEKILDGLIKREYMISKNLQFNESMNHGYMLM